MSLADDDRPRKAARPQPDEPLGDLSLHELEERIRIYRAEIDRLEGELQAKQGSRAAADSLFRR